MRRLLPFALAALLFLTLLPGLAAIEATDWREARDAEVVRESTAGREWIAALYGYEPLFEKPLPGYAHEVVAQRLMRRLVRADAANLTDVATSRAVRAALAAALALMVGVVGARAFGTRAGWLAGCALASSVGLPLAARADGGQILATLCAWFAIAAFLGVLQGRARRPGLARYAGWAALGLAAMTGGPLSALWPLGGFGLYFALAKARGAWRELEPGWGALVVAGIVLPWYAIMTALHGTAFLSHVPWFPYAIETRGTWLAGPLSALSYTLVLGFPWTPLLGASLRDGIERLRLPRAEREHQLRDPAHAQSLLLALLLAGGAPVALYPGPPLTAALPALPALALLCGRFLDRVLDGDVDRRHLSVATQFTAMLGTLLALLAVTLATRLPAAAHGLQLLGAALLLASWAPFLADFLGRRKVAASLFALPVAIGAPVLLTQVLPPLEPWLNTRAVAEAMMSDAPANAPLALLEPELPSLRLLLPRHLVQVADVDSSLRTLVSHDGRAYLAFRPARETEVVRALPPGSEILVRTPTLVLARVDFHPER
ncbi:MAG: hypothetical protein U0704_18060 [Candidatus Eisenbacteria bacterium]